MDKSFYKKEAASLQSLFEKFNAIQFTSDQNISKATNDTNNTDASSRSKDVLIVPIILFLLIVGMIGFLTMWLVN